MTCVHTVWQIIAGPAAGRSLRFNTDGATTVGRTDAADIQLAEDFFLSRVHFAVHYDGNEWRIRDLESRHGILLNGERVSEAALSDGDVLQAGKSEFRIGTSLSEDDSVHGAAVAATAVAAVLFTGVQASRRAPSTAPEYEPVDCPSGTKAVEGTMPDPPPAEVAWLLAREHPLFLLADFSKVSLPLPEQLKQIDFLFNWMDDDVLPHCSPVLLGPADPVDPYEVIDELWGQDAVLCLYSQLEKPELLVRLRAAIRRDDGLSTAVPRGILGYCWPEAARAVLESAPEKLTAPLMNCLTALLVESEDLQRWRVFFADEAEQNVLAALKT